MSYEGLPSLEAGTQRPSQAYSDNPGFQALQRQLVGQLQNLRRNISRLATDVNLLGTKRDSARARERTNDLLEKSREMCKDIGDGVKKLQTIEDLSKQQKYEQSRVSSEFQNALQEFQDLQHRALDSQRASVFAARAAHGSEATDGEEYRGQGGRQEQMLLQEQVVALANQDEVDFQESIIVQREDEIRAIEQGVNDLNVLFKQVAHIVHQQGDTLVTIVDHVEDIRDDVMAADRENRQAARHQKAARNKGCCLLIILTLIMAIVLLAILLG